MAAEARHHCVLGYGGGESCGSKTSSRDCVQERRRVFMPTI